MNKKNELKRIIKYTMVAAIAIMCTFALTSCSKEKVNKKIPEGLIGTWVGEAPMSSSIYYTGEATFNSNGTFTHYILGEKNGEFRLRQSYAGTYTVSGSTVTCTGSMERVDRNGEVETGDNREIKFTYSGSTLSGGSYTTMVFSKQ